ncbi:hypothetical protein HWV62_24748 [Athelia sp. TMB]|nr:hypothetical protein HWV62_24748 [Athelia sp. TMB]
MSDYTSNSPSRPGSPVGNLPEIPSTRPYRFQFDPTRRGPASVSETTEGRGGDYFGVSPRVDIFGASSAALEVPSEWSSSRHGFHAISTVLNNPHKKQAPPKAHSALPSAAPADLPRVRRKDFDSYLRAVGPEWDRYERNAQLGREGAARLDGSSSSSEVTRKPGRAIPPLNVVPTVFFDASFNLGDPGTFNAVTEQSDGEDPSSLSHSLPLLEKLSHYADTIEQHLVQEISLRSTSFFAALTNLHDLRSESEECLDRIAKLRGLLSDVDEKSAKKGLQIIRQDGKVRNLRKVAHGVKEIEGVVEMTGVARGLVGAGQWGEALNVIEEMDALWKAESTETSSTILPTRRQTSSPLPSMPESPPPGDPMPKRRSLSVPLSSLQAFANLPQHLQTLTLEIASSLTTELVDVLRLDLLERINLESGEGGNHEIDRSLRDRLRPLLQGLSRTKGMREATVSWREVVLSEVRGTMKRVCLFVFHAACLNLTMRRKHIPLFDNEAEGANGTGDKSANADQLRAMDQENFMELIRAIYRSLLGCVEGLRIQNFIIVEEVQSMQPATLIEIPALQEELADVLASAAELSNAQVAKVIGIRAEQHAKLDMPEFLAFFNESWSFVVRCEVICRRMIVGLRGAVVSQSKVFLQTYHQSRISQSAKLVEDEQWNPVEVTPALQHLADLLVDAAMRDPPEITLSANGALPPASPISPISAPSSATPAPAPPALAPTPLAPAPPTNGAGSPPTSPTRRSKANGSSASKHLRIEDRTYFTVSATAAVLALLVDYLRVIVNLRTLTTDTMGRAIEFLKAFNSRTCQVVLGAGAMRSAGLKNITAKHLALASQSLSIMIALIPYVRETFRRHLSMKQAVMLVEFDKLKRTRDAADPRVSPQDYQEHQNEIHAKLIAIMGDRLSVHIKSLQAVDWAAPREASGVNGYMELLVKETVTLHKVLSRYLSVPVVEVRGLMSRFTRRSHDPLLPFLPISASPAFGAQYVMTQVFAAMNHRLSEEYAAIDLPTPEAKEKMLADARFLHGKVAALKNVGAPSAMLETVIGEKRVLAPAPAPAPATLSANDRIKSMLTRRDSALFGGGSKDKALPTPAQTPPLLAPSPVPGGFASPGFAGSDVTTPARSQVVSPARPESPLPALPSDAPDVDPMGDRLDVVARPPRSSSLASREGSRSPAPES